MHPADGHFGPFRRLGDTDDHGKRYAAYHFLFTFSRYWRRKFFGLNDVLATSSGHLASVATLTGRVDFVHWLSLLTNVNVIMAALRSRCGHCILQLWFFFFFLLVFFIA